MSLSASTLRVGIVAILVGLVGAYGVRTMLNKEVVEEKKGPETITVPLASADLPEDRIVSMGDISLVGMTAKQMEERNIPIGLAMVSPGQIIGRRLRGPIKQGQPFLTTELYLEGNSPAISKLLKPGYRAIEIRIPSSRGGSAQTGSTVDVLFRSSPRKGSDTSLPIPETTVTVIEGAEVLRVSHPQPASRSTGTLDLRRVNSTMDMTPTITLAMTLEQANILQTVTGRGEISLITRPASETMANSARLPKAMTLEDLLGIEPPEPTPVPSPPFQSEIYRRGAMQRMTFTSNGQVALVSDVISPRYQPATDALATDDGSN